MCQRMSDSKAIHICTTQHKLPIKQIQNDQMLQNVPSFSWKCFLQSLNGQSTFVFNPFQMFSHTAAFLLFIGVCYGYKDHAPDSVCGTMHPNHDGAVSMNLATFPTKYRVTVDKPCYAAGDTVTGQFCISVAQMLNCCPITCAIGSPCGLSFP